MLISLESVLTCIGANRFVQDERCKDPVKDLF